MGIYTITTHAPNAAGANGSFTMLNRCRFDQTVFVSSITAISAAGGMTNTLAARIYDASGVLVGSGPPVTTTGATSLVLPLSPAVRLVANTDYYVGMYQSTGSNMGVNTAVGSTHTHGSSPAGVTYTYVNVRTANGDSFTAGASEVVGWEYCLTISLQWPANKQSRRGYNAPIIGRGRRGIGP